MEHPGRVWDLTRHRPDSVRRGSTVPAPGGKRRYDSAKIGSAANSAAPPPHNSLPRYSETLPLGWAMTCRRQGEKLLHLFSYEVPALSCRGNMPEAAVCSVASRHPVLAGLINGDIHFPPSFLPLDDAVPCHKQYAVAHMPSQRWSFLMPRASGARTNLWE